jgi:hypothetical protein
MSTDENNELPLSWQLNMTIVSTNQKVIPVNSTFPSVNSTFPFFVNSISNCNESVNVIISDSGASRCMFSNRSYFSNYRDNNNILVQLVDGIYIPVLGIGTVAFIPNCLHIPTLKKDLISASHLDLDLGFTILHKNKQCFIVNKQNNIVATETWILIVVCMCLLHRL